MDRDVTTGKSSPFSVFCWNSRRLRRVARSSTSDKFKCQATLLINTNFASCLFIFGAVLKVDLGKRDEVIALQESFLISDSKNVFDRLERIQTSGLQMEERKTAIELVGIKERLSQANVKCKWVSGDQELADGLTKPWQGRPTYQGFRKKGMGYSF